MKRRFRMRYQGVEFSVTAERSGDTIVIERDGRSYRVDIVPDESASLRKAPPPGPAGSGAGARPAGPVGGSLQSASPAAGPGTVSAPMTGTIKDVMVNVGDTVNEGDHVMVMEAMKMDMEISAHTSGTVKQIMCASGDSVKENQALLRIE